MALSGTPMGGKPVNLWPVLHFLDPEEFTSKWRWAENWLYIDNNGYGASFGEVRKELRPEFDKYITRYMLRRTKAEVYKDLPPKTYVPIWVEMGPKQAKQYKEFALAAEVKIEEDKLYATSILAEYMRLKQFAISYSKIEWIDRAEGKYKVIPDGTVDSGKLEALEELLEERGVFDDAQDVEEQIVIFSQFSVVVDWVCKWLMDKGVEPLKITGKVGQRGRNEAQRKFQANKAKVIVMTTTAGGVSITLDAADTVIFMDETWVPDDQEQGEDRIHRVSRIHNVTCYYLRTTGTIEEYIEKRVARKQNVNNVNCLNVLSKKKRNAKSVKNKLFVLSWNVNVNERLVLNKKLVLNWNELNVSKMKNVLNVNVLKRNVWNKRNLTLLVRKKKLVLLKKNVSKKLLSRK